ncbi:hypothetical protein BD769DRAFT_1626613 [Suillus cothurnatus]|nr:hypothetical protein BD769DRAFT_1626613 [Suillus cothurnatus]
MPMVIFLMIMHYHHLVNLDLYATIDAIPLGEVKWESFLCLYTGEKPEGSYPPWMDGTFDVWYQDPHQVERSTTIDFMSANWAWDQADTISKDPDTIGATFVPVILGSDKITVSVGTGNNEYYLLYLSIGNVHNNVQRAHQNTVAVIGFLAMPKSE